MKSGIDPKVDYVFKKLFGSEEYKPILIDLLNAVLGEEIADVELLNPFNPQEFEGDKLSILDVKARLRDGRLVNVEMQMWADRYYPNRTLYYWAESYTGQLKDGEEYDLLCKTIGIHFVNSSLFKETRRHHLSFKLQCREESEISLSDQLEIHLFQLPNFKLAKHELNGRLDNWCYFMKHGSEMDRNDLIGIPNSTPISKALEVLKVISLDEKERMQYRARIRARRDEVARNAALQELGLAKGLAKGLEKGTANGLSKALTAAMEEKFGIPAQAFKKQINRMKSEERLLDLIRHLVTDKTLEEFAARLDKTK